MTPSVSPAAYPGASPGGMSRSAIAAAAAVTVIDGFDAFSLSLAAPRLVADLGIGPSALGLAFAATMGGMILGAFAGGVLADKVGRLRILLVALLLFGLAALTMVLATDATDIVVNRVIAGVGMGAAAPIAVALLNRSGASPPSDFVVSIVWAGLAVGGIAAAAFNYLAIPAFGWRSIFVVGGLLPIPVAGFVVVVFGRTDPGAQQADRTERPRLSQLFAGDAAGATVATALMFFFGYVTTSIINNWLPTILTQGKASVLLVSLAFAGMNVGSAIATLALGFLSSRAKSPRLLSAAWALTACCVAGAAWPALGLLPVTLLAVGGATLGAGTQALSVAFANRLHRERHLESATVGLMISAGRIGQFGALTASGFVVEIGLPETSLFAFAGISASIAAAFAWHVVTLQQARSAAGRAV